MAIRESFLINPARRRKKKSSLLSSLFGNAKRKRRTKKSSSLFGNPTRRRKSSKRNALPGPLLRRMMKKYGPREGMRHAWAEYKRGVKRNPFGEEVIVVGANPHRKKGIKTRKVVKVMARRKRKVRRNAFAGSPAKHRSAALKGWRKRRRVSANPKRRRAGASRRRSVVRYRDNPRRVRRYSSNRYVRRYRRNPAAVATMGGISLSKPFTLLMPIAVGLAARIATQRVPMFLRIVAPLPRYGVQAAVAVGGGILLNRFVGRTNAMVWTIVSGVTILESILNDYVFKTTVAGIGAYPENLGYTETEDVGAYPMTGEVQY